MVAKFPYDKAVACIAEADVFGDKRACEKFKINRATLRRWRLRASDDYKMQQDVARVRKLLLHNWQEDATKTLRVGLQELRRRFVEASTRDDSYIINAIAASVKVVGDLKIEASIILDSDTDDGDSQTIYNQVEEGEVESETATEEEWEEDTN